MANKRVVRAATRCAARWQHSLDDGDKVVSATTVEPEDELPAAEASAEAPSPP